MAWVPVEIIPHVYYHRISADNVELIFNDIDTAIWIIKKQTACEFWVLIHHKPTAIFKVQSEDAEYWTNYWRLKEDFANSNSRAMFRSALIDILRPLRPYLKV
jgi:limonene-1,2-epoxide hydrolase